MMIGKTIYIKQAALLVFMSMIGSYVAASDAFIGDFDRIYARICSDHTIACGLSSFAAELKQMSDAMNNSTLKSLLVIDELGKSKHSSSKTTYQ
jgi:DNA mismatch repair ATPase MutS